MFRNSKFTCIFEQMYCLQDKHRVMLILFLEGPDKSFGGQSMHRKTGKKHDEYNNKNSNRITAIIKAQQ